MKSYDEWNFINDLDPVLRVLNEYWVAMGEIEVSSLLVVIVHLALLISLNGWANSYNLSKLDKCGMWLLDAVCSMQGPDAMHIRFGQANSADKTDHVNNNCQDNIFLGFSCLRKCVLTLEIESSKERIHQIFSQASNLF